MYKESESLVPEQIRPLIAQPNECNPKLPEISVTFIKLLLENISYVNLLFSRNFQFSFGTG